MNPAFDGMFNRIAVAGVNQEMSDMLNIYCDESCHLEHDGIPVMALGAVWCREQRVQEISRRLTEIKSAHRLAARGKPRETACKIVGEAPGFELKWTKVSPALQRFYLDVVDYFFDGDDLHFRGMIINKTALDHRRFSQTHDDWYYKMLFTLLEPIIDPEQQHRIYLDIKDTRSEEKRKKLQEVLRGSRRDGRGRIIDRVQQIRSHESELMQLTDLLLGAVAYDNRRRAGELPKAGSRLSGAKLAIIERIRHRTGHSLHETTWLRESKFNLLHWKP